MLVDVLCLQQGRVRAIVKYGATSKKRALLQPANHVQLQGTARLASHMPRAEVELLTPYFALMMGDGLALAVGLAANALCSAYLPERQRYSRIYHALHYVYHAMGGKGSVYMAEYARFELCLLQECGYGLQLDYCVATGCTQELCYISPKSGEAVSREAGAPYRDKLFAYPLFLRDDNHAATISEIMESLRITGHFIEQRMSDGRHAPWMDARKRMMVQLEHYEEKSKAREKISELFCE